MGARKGILQLIAYNVTALDWRMVEMKRRRMDCALFVKDVSMHILTKIFRATSPHAPSIGGLMMCSFLLL